ncbi:MAG: hypothetical protein HC913_06160 [Microscillaceae bacterium]|nr:hypothetical protein [Microscillaceae bacterium]
MLFLCLNSEDNLRGAGRGTIGDTQYEYIKKVLAANPSVKWTLLFMHQPLWIQEDTQRWQEVEALLANRKHTVFVGHIHRYIKFERNNGKYFTLATTGGGTRLRGPQLGEFDHVVWVTMTEEGPLLANLMLEGIWDENVSTQAMSEFARPLADGFPMMLDPILISEEDYQGSTAMVKITNDSDGLMEVALEFAAHPQFYTDVVRKSLSIQPNSVEMLPIKIQSFAPVRLSDAEPLVLKAQITYKKEAFPDIQLQKMYQIRPEPRRMLYPADKKIKVDGDLKDWGTLAYLSTEQAHLVANPFAHQGNQDASFRFDVRYDEEFLYFAIKVQDDEILTDANRWGDDQDGITLIVNARPEKQSANTTGGWNESLYLIQNPADKMVSQFFRPGRLPEGVGGVTRRTPEGYQSEFKIPIAYLQKIYGSPDWQSVRLNVRVSDWDQQFQHETQLYWQPDWGSPENYIGSGLFTKAENQPEKK